MPGDVEAFVQDYVDRVWNQADSAALAELVTPDFSYQIAGQPPRDRAALAEFLKMVHTAFPDWRVNILECVTNRHSAAIRWDGEVTHSGPFHGIPPSGKRIKVSGMNFYRIEGGKIAAEWEQMDSLGMLQQMGALPAR